MTTRPTYRNRSLTFTAVAAACALATVNGCSSSKSQEASDEVAPALDGAAPAGTDQLPPSADASASTTPPAPPTDPAQETTVAKTDTPPVTPKPAAHKKAKAKHAANTGTHHRKPTPVAPPVETVQDATPPPPAPAEPAPAPTAVQAQAPAPITPPPAAPVAVAKTAEQNTPSRTPASPGNSEAKADEVAAESGGGLADTLARYRNAILGSAVVIAVGVAGLTMKKKKSTQV